MMCKTSPLHLVIRYTIYDKHWTQGRIQERAKIVQPFFSSKMNENMPFCTKNIGAFYRFHKFYGGNASSDHPWTRIRDYNTSFSVPTVA